MDCGLCAEVCPIRHRPPSSTPMGAYAVQLLDRQTLMSSTSGGVFSLLAREMFRRGGVVYGCVWDERYRAVIRKAETMEALAPMRGSKYVWSDTDDTYREAKALLDAGRGVLYAGLPCQIAGLQGYLRKSYPNLVLLDFLCGGAPSPRAFSAYLNTIAGEADLPGLELQFRDKQKYGVGVNISYQTRKGIVRQDYVSNPYFYSYHTKLFHRRACYRCPFKNQYRIADLTMGDYWRIREYHPQFDARSGVSLLLCNSQKGMAMFERVRDQAQAVNSTVKAIANGNALLLTGGADTLTVPPKRQEMFDTLAREGWRGVEKRYLHTRRRLFLKLMLHCPPGLKTGLRKARDAVKGGSR